MTSAIRVVRCGAIIELTLSRTACRNALDRAALRELAAVVSSVTVEVRAIVLTGAGSVFSAGADLTELEGTQDDLGFDWLLGEVVAAIANAPQVVIAAVEGACIGAAVELALSCDACVASSSAFFELPAVRLGLLYRPAAVARLHATLPRQALTRLLLLGERLDAAAASTLGLATRLAPVGEAVAAAHELANAAADGDARALIATKELLRALDRRERELDRFERVRGELVSSPARRAALAAARRRDAGTGVLGAT